MNVERTYRKSSLEILKWPCAQFMRSSASLPRPLSYPHSHISDTMIDVSSYHRCVRSRNSPVRSSSAEVLGTQYVRYGAIETAGPINDGHGALSVAETSSAAQK